jgi:uncharacterized protein with HEPN domain
MSRNRSARLQDIEIACVAIIDYTAREAVDSDIIFDAIRIRLVEIGEAVKALDEDDLSSEQTVPWPDLARMRDLLAHRYFDTTHGIVMDTARNDIPALLAAIRRLQEK